LHVSSKNDIIMKKFIYLIILASVCFPLAVLAQKVVIENPINSPDIVSVLRSILNWIFGIAMALGPIMYILSGYRFITAAGEPEKINTAKKMALWTSIGLAIAIACRAIIALIGEILGINLVI